jgi:uncharacterized NAD-dependent epimerase/dehydratase family protein
MDIKKLPNFNKLTKKEQERLLEISKPRIDSNYNIDGSLSVSKKEINKNA